MNDNGKLITFPQLVQEYQEIVTPKVQRDYAYGRDDAKVRQILNGMLDSMLDAVKADTSVTLDFVYGGPYVKQGNITAGMTPLDGQQRLTTLFLLFFYASLLKEHGKADEEISLLLHFKYETRQTATEFCRDLIEKIRPRLLRQYGEEKGKTIKELITDDPCYLVATYDNDPTIASMLNVLNRIEEMCREKGMIELEPCLWTRLMERQNIRFYTLPLDDFGLTDDLYIKMNSRGKLLTQFEIFKADVMAAIKDVEDSDPAAKGTLRETFSTKMDTQWIDMVWASTNQNIDDSHTELDVTTEADQHYFNLFKNVLALEYYRRDMISEQVKPENVRNHLAAKPQIIFSDTTSTERVISYFDTLYSIYKGRGFQAEWDDYFYYSADEVTGRTGKIRWFRRLNYRNLFEAAMGDSLSVPQTVYFYALLLLAETDYEDDVKQRCMRVIRNLVNGNERLVDVRNPKLPGFLKEAEYVIASQGIFQNVSEDGNIIINGEPHKIAFNQNCWTEEYVKCNAMPDEVARELLKYENHQMLQASLSLFIDFCRAKDDAATIDTDHLLRLLDRFDAIFSNTYTQYLDLLRINLLDKHTDYLQYDTNMDTANFHKRYFITSSWTLERPQLFIKYKDRHNQESLLERLEAMPLPEDMKVPDDKCKEFTTEDWQYYLAKYPKESNNPNTTYGIGMWEDKVNRPLELIILNSKQYGEYNLEWNMMNTTLFSKLNDGQAFYLDPHNCNPIVAAANGAKFDFKQDGWHVNTDIDLPSLLACRDDLSCKSEDDQYIVTFRSATHSEDYIELGLELVRHTRSKPQPTT